MVRTLPVTVGTETTEDVSLKKRTRVENETKKSRTKATTVVVEEVKPKRRSKKAAEVAEPAPVDKVAEPLVVAADKKGRKKTVEKTPKQKPEKVTTPVVLSVDKNGLSIMPVRVKRLLLDVVFNRSFRLADKELVANKDALLEASNLKEGYLSFHGFTQPTLTYLRGLLADHLASERTKFERKKLKALVDECPKDEAGKPVVSATLQELINATKLSAKNNESVQSLYEGFNKKFYKEFTVQQKIYNLTGEEGFKFYRSLIARDKVRMNVQANLRLTGFFELVLKHLITKASSACVVNGKTTVNYSNMSGVGTDATYLASIVESLNTWNAALSWQTGGRVTDDTTKKTPVSFVDLEKLNPGNKFKLYSYVVDICKNVSRELADSHSTDEAYSNVKTSGEFRNLCNQILLELVHSAGNILKVITSTGRDRTVTVGTVDALIQTYHLAFNLTNRVQDTLTELDTLTETFTTLQSTLKASKPRRNNLTRGVSKQTTV
jgi:hypothetical protein